MILNETEQGGQNNYKKQESRMQLWIWNISTKKCAKTLKNESWWKKTKVWVLTLMFNSIRPTNQITPPTSHHGSYHTSTHPPHWESIHHKRKHYIFKAEAIVMWNGCVKEMCICIIFVCFSSLVSQYNLDVAGVLVNFSKLCLRQFIVSRISSHNI